MKINKTIGLFFILVMSNITNAQTKNDVEAIQSMCGCYEVTFNFAETFSADTSYKFHKNYHASALEWVEMVSDKKSKFVLQHILIAGEDYIVKHWRQDWVYQPKSTMSYDQERRWLFHPANQNLSQGAWEQRVFQVDDSPRYAGVGTWVHLDGKHYWEAEARAPLPRRDYSKRSDYDIMLRRNRHEITSEGWIHEQDNKKIVVKEGGEELVLVEEKGRNKYTKVDDTKCTPAIKYWKKNAQFWENVRKSWGAHYPTDGELVVATKVDNKLLYEHLSSFPEKRVEELINRFVDVQINE